MKSRKKICFISTTPYPLHVFMRPHIIRLSVDYDITLIANGQTSDFADLVSDSVKFVSVKIERKISLLNDIFALINLYKILSINRFDVVHSIMPKTSLLGMTAAYFAGVPFRVHTFTGQVWVNRSFLSSLFLMKIDQIVATCATNLLTDSSSQRQFLIDKKIVKPSKILVLGNGSVCGVDVERFKPDPNTRKHLRTQFNIDEDSVVFLFLGRVNIEKGVLELAEAFFNIAKNHSNVHLFIVGPDELQVSKTITILLESVINQYHRIGYTDTPEKYMAMADVLCLPSHREGFGSVLIEAAATGLPTIASNIYGITDAMIHNVTGILHDAKNINQIECAMLSMLKNNTLRKKMGNAGKLRAIKYFRTQYLVDEMAIFYKKLF